MSRSKGVRRLLQESAELAASTDPSFSAAPLEDDLFEWHYSLQGVGGDFEGGVYHGRIVLPAEYPFRPPEVYLLNASGRFEVNKKLCLSISSFHPETWQPSWGIRTVLIALMAFFASEPKGAIGSLDVPSEERRRLAAASQHYTCPTCSFSARTFIACQKATKPPDVAAAAAAEIEDQPAMVASADRDFETTTIFPSPRHGLSVDVGAVGSAVSGVGGGAGSGHGAGGGEEGMNPGRRVEMPPQLPILGHRAMERPLAVAAVAESSSPPPTPVLMRSDNALAGGSPLLVDRAILVILLALLALIVQKIA